MHDLNAKKIKHEQARRNTETEAHKPSKWDTPLLIIICLLLIAVYIKGA